MLVDGGNRELLSVIGSVSTDGQVLPSLILYRRAHHEMGWQRFTEKLRFT